MATRRNKKKNSGSHMGCLILLVGFIVLLVVFAIKLPEIKTALEETRFIDLVKQRVTTTTSAPAPAPQNKPTPAAPSPSVQPAAPTPSGARPKTPSAEPPAPAAPSTTSQAIPSPGASIPATSLPETAPAAQRPASTAAPAASRMAALFFVKIEEDGTISRQEVKRAVPASDVPLTDALNALFAGPSEAEIRSGLVSLIPRGTKLLGATVRGSTATINVSEAFMYNRYAVEGYSAQLRQIVYTATAFTSIQDVQFLVEGKQKDYLGGEGVYIGKPLSRNSF
ncbi:GerMN domain-containing protein [bacterium]|nr:GerMN domain-containing protein [bacterium]